MYVRKTATVLGLLLIVFAAGLVWISKNLETDIGFDIGLIPPYLRPGGSNAVPRSYEDGLPLLSCENVPDDSVLALHCGEGTFI